MVRQIGESEMRARQSAWSKKILAVYISAISVYGNDVFADSKLNDEAKKLETVQVLGSDAEDFNVAMTEDMIEKRQATDLEDLLRHEPSITVGGGLPVAQKVYVRGLEDTLLNVTIDGATQAGYLYHHQGRINVEPELIKAVELKAGAGNATDGAGALGGAIHFKLKDAKDMLRDGERVGALIKGSYFSNNGALKSHASAYTLLTDDFGLLASFTQLESNDNYEDGEGNEIPKTEIEQQDIRLKLSGNISKEHYLGVSYEQYEDDGVRFARPNMVDIGIHPVYPSPAVPQESHRESVVLNYGFNPENALIDFESSLYYNDSYLTKQGDVFAATWPIAGPPPTWTYADYHNGKAHGGGVESIGLNLTNTAHFGQNSITYGAEYRQDEGYLINPAVTSFNEEELSVSALYIQADLVASDSVSISTGLRYDNYDYKDNHGETFQDESISPNLTLTFDVNDELSWHAGVAKAFKGVSIPEIWFLEFPPAGTTMANYQGADFASGDFTLGAVEAEESMNTEIGFKYEGLDFAASGEVYRQTIEHAQVTSSTDRYSYVDDVTVEGYSLRGAYYLGNITFNAGVSKSKPELGGQALSNGDMGLGTAYGRTWTTGVEYAPEQSLTLGWNSRFVERLDEVRDDQDKKDGYGIHDVYVQWAPVKDLTLGLAVNNILDKFYYDHGTFYTSDSTKSPYGLAEPGRDIRASVAYQF